MASVLKIHLSGDVIKALEGETIAGLHVKLLTGTVKEINTARCTLYNDKYITIFEIKSRSLFTTCFAAENVVSHLMTRGKIYDILGIKKC